MTTRTSHARFAALCAASLTVAAALADRAIPVAIDASAIIRPIVSEGGGLRVELDLPALRTLRDENRSFRIAAFPIAAARGVDLELSPLAVVTPETRFVLGHDQTPLSFDPASVVLLTGHAPGIAGSHVYLAISEHGAYGYLALNREGRFAMSSRSAAGEIAGPGEALIFDASNAAGGSLPDVPMCGADTGGWTGRIPYGLPNSNAPFTPPGQRGVTPIRGLRQIQLAVETDYEYFTLFNDLNAAGAYIVALYGAISDIYIRDVRAEVTLSFVRLWDNPADLFNEEDPLTPFLEYWNDNMQNVVRDAAQFTSGRRNLPAGGVAYLGALCTDFGYSWGGYVLGYFTDPSRPDIYNRDIMILAHELGHNCDTPHTHDLGLDTCQDQNSQPRRGTIMSYCSQTFTGGDGNVDIWFHTVCQQIMEDFIAQQSPCVTFDCNRNGINDATELGSSTDTNGNGVLDVCEDCDGDGTLDPMEIAANPNLDRNQNQVLDECEPDCNDNNIPDDLDFLPGQPIPIFSDNFETDLGWTVTNQGATSGNWERGIPVNDPGWAHDPTSDYDGSGRCYLTQNAAGNTDVDNGGTRLTSPQLNLSAGNLSVGYAYFLRMDNAANVDRILVEGSANNGSTWATLAIHGTDGGLAWRTHVISPADFALAGLAQNAQFRIRFTINDANPQSIVEGGIDAFFIGQPPAAPVSEDFNANAVPDECEGDCDNDGVLDYEEIVANMALDLNRNVILDSCEDCDTDGTTDLVELNHSHSVWVAARESPALREYLSKYGTQTLTSASGTLQEPQDLIITPTRRILVTSRVDNRVAEFNLAGQFVGNLVAAGGGGLNNPATMAIAPDGSLLVASRNTNSVLRYNSTTGASLGAFIAAGAGGLTQPFGMAYGPNGNLFVTSNNNQILEYNGTSGAFVRIFVAAGANGGLSNPRGILWNPRTGNLLVCSANTNQVLEYSGASGAFLRNWAQVGTATVMTLDQPWCLRVGPEGDIYCSRYNLAAFAPGGGPGASADDQGDHDHGDDYHDEHHEHEELHLTNARVYHFDADNGYFVRAFIMGVNSNITNPTGFDFVPDAGTDCNYNLRPDNCDIAQGFSSDANSNGVPDECEDVVPCPGDLDGSGAVDLSDLATLLAHFGEPSGAGPEDGDLDGDMDVDLSDLAVLLANFGATCP